MGQHASMNCRLKQMCTEKKKQNKTKYILKSAYLRIKSNGHFIIKTNDLSFESSSVHFEAGNTERNTERNTET